MATANELQKRIEALENAGLDASAEKEQLAKLTPKKKVAAEAGILGPAEEMVTFDIEVDEDAFERGGQVYGAPTEPGIYSGTFEEIVIPTTKTEQRWFVFKTADPRVLEQLGRQTRSALIVTPMGAGAFKLKDILDSLNLSYIVEESHVKGSIPRGLPCELEYQEVSIGGKTQMRLQNVYAAGSVESAF